METDDGYILILTKGTHLISRETAERVRAAIEGDDAIVHVRLDPFGDVDPERTTMIAVRHIVALTKNAGAAATASATNLAAFRRPRTGR